MINDYKWLVPLQVLMTNDNRTNLMDDNEAISIECEMCHFEEKGSFSLSFTAPFANILVYAIIITRRPGSHNLACEGLSFANNKKDGPQNGILTEFFITKSFFVEIPVSYWFFFRSYFFDINLMVFVVVFSFVPAARKERKVHR